MEYTLRKIKSTDLGKVCRILSKIGIREIVDSIDMKEIIGDADVENEETAAQVGISVAAACGDVVLRNIDKCIDDIIDYLEDLSGIDKETINDDPAMMMEMVIDYFKKEEFKDFSRVVSKFISKKTI